MRKLKVEDPKFYEEVTSKLGGAVKNDAPKGWR